MKFYIPVLVLALAATFVACDDEATLRAEYKAFQARHGRNFRSAAKEEQGFARYKARRAEVQSHNELFANGQVAFQMGINELSDLSEDELKMRRGVNLPPEAAAVAAEPLAAENQVNEMPNRAKREQVGIRTDWRSLIPIVRNQGSCGSCWSFSVNGALEGALKRVCNKTVDVSEQYLVDCSPNTAPYYTSGCGGGWPFGAIQYLADKDTTTEYNYPYKGVAGTCDARAPKIGVKLELVTPGQKVSTWDYRLTDEQLRAALDKWGPLSICIEATSSFNAYKTGIYSPTDAKNGCNHAIVAVGWGYDASQGYYYIVKNSWGDWWGEKGYMRMRAGTPTGILKFVFGVNIKQCPK